MPSAILTSLQEGLNIHASRGYGHSCF